MVDQRADEDRDFRVFRDPVNTRPSWGELWEQARDWLFARQGAPAQARRVASPAGSRTRDDAGVRLRRWAAVASVLWTVILGTYGLGYFLRLEAVDGATRLFPTMDLLFFAFAIAGPVAMLWIAVIILERAAGLSQAIEGQSESALALAATLSNLNDSVDALSAGTTGRLEQACDRMEREARSSVTALERNLHDATVRLESALLDSVTMLHDRTRDRDDQAEKRMEAHQARVEARLSEEVGRLAMAIETERAALTGTREMLSARIEAGLDASRNHMEAATGELLARQEAAAGELLARQEATTRDLHARQESGLDTTNQRVLAAVAQVDQRLNELHERQARIVEEDLAPPLEEIGRRLEQTRQSVAAHPPATSEALADLLGKSAQQLVRFERAAVEECIRRIAQLEEQAGTMLDMIDRTSRLNPLMDTQTRPQIVQPAPPSEPEGLPFAVLPRSAERMELNWDAVLRLLSGQELPARLRHVAERAAADPDLAAVIGLTGELAAALAEDRIFLEDLAVDHAPAGLWTRFSQGERGGEITALAGIGDEVSLALVRALMRKNEGFPALGLRHQAAYLRLLARAVADLGEHPRLVELAETPAGRAFMLLGALTGTFERAVPPVPGEDA